jgi:soluble lytic murein transglycosylase
LIFLLASFAIVLTIALVSGRGLPAPLAGRLYPLHYESEIAGVAERYDLDPYLVAAVVKAESDFKPEAVSRAGAVGLMQVMPETANWISQRADWAGPADPNLDDPRDNLELGTYYLSYLISMFDADVGTALAAYNAGHGAVQSWLQQGEETRVSLEQIPFRETRDFVERVKRFESVFRRAHPKAFP